MKTWRKNAGGQYICDGDCTSWSYGICTCGLYHHFLASEELDLTFFDIQMRLWHNIVKEYIVHRIITGKKSLQKPHYCVHRVDLDVECSECNKEIDRILDDLTK